MLFWEFGLVLAQQTNLFWKALQTRRTEMRELGCPGAGSRLYSLQKSWNCSAGGGLPWSKVLQSFFPFWIMCTPACRISNHVILGLPRCSEDGRLISERELRKHIFPSTFASCPDRFSHSTCMWVFSKHLRAWYVEGNIGQLPCIFSAWKLDLHPKGKVREIS